MADRTYKLDRHEEDRYKGDASHPKPDELDGILDAALVNYATAEPRPGLEHRILANLQIEQTRVARSQTARPAWWRWSLSGVAAITVLVAVISWRWNPVPHPPIARNPATITPGMEESATRVAMNSGSQLRPAHAPTLTGTGHARITVLATPKLDVFPSPQPLSIQEQILADYVMRYHRQAVLIARVTNEELQRDRAEVLGGFASTADLGESTDTDREKTNR